MYSYFITIHENMTNELGQTPDVSPKVALVG